MSISNFLFYELLPKYRCNELIKYINNLVEVNLASEKIVMAFSLDLDSLSFRHEPDLLTLHPGLGLVLY